MGMTLSSAAMACLLVSIALMNVGSCREPTAEHGDRHTAHSHLCLRSHEWVRTQAWASGSRAQTRPVDTMVCSLDTHT